MTHDGGGDKLRTGWYLSKVDTADGQTEWMKGPGTVAQVRRELTLQLHDVDRSTRQAEIDRVIHQGLNKHVNAQFAEYREDPSPENREALAAAAAEDSGDGARQRTQNRSAKEIIIQVDADGRPDIEAPDGVKFQADQKTLVIETTVPGNVHVLLSKKTGESKERMIVLRTDKEGTLSVTGAGGGSAIRNGAGEGNAVRTGDGAGDAIRMGTGDGNALRDGRGGGSALRDDQGDGDGQRWGQGDGDAIRAGSGAGNAHSTTSGKGDAIVRDNAKGKAERGGEGSGDARIRDDATGDALRRGEGAGTASIEPTATGTAAIKRWPDIDLPPPTPPVPAPPLAASYEERPSGRETLKR